MRALARGRTRNRLLLGAVVITILGTAALIGDPTESTFYVRIANDSSRTVLIRDCEDRCYSQRLRPGAVSAADYFASAGVANPVTVLTSDGEPLGCLPLLFDRVMPGLRVRASTASAC
jgi:hypothetical protein